MVLDTVARLARVFAALDFADFDDFGLRRILAALLADDFDDFRGRDI